MLNKISYERYVNENKGNRVEFRLTNFDYYDGIDYLAKLFCEKYSMRADEKVEGIFFDFIIQSICGTAQLEAQLSAVIQEINFSL